MSAQNLIPIPPSQKLRLFRENHVPWITFSIMVVIAFILWTHYVFPSPLVGKVEAVELNIACPKEGVLTELKVSRFQPVSAGQIIGEVTVTDPKVLEASLGVIKAEIELIRAGLSPILDSHRGAISFEQIEMTYMRQKVDLATARVQLQLAQSEYQRTSDLFKDKIVSAAAFDSAKAELDGKMAEVNERTQLLNVSSNSLVALRAVKDSAKEPQSQIQAAIAVQDEKLKLAEAEMKPFILRSPIDGVINMTYLRTGEAVKAGDTVVTVSATNSTRIIGYMRQPLYQVPKVGAQVEVRIRRLNQPMGLGKILAVGAQLQPINDALLPPTKYNISEHGLPIMVSLPPELRVHPGEFVDLRILKSNTASN